MSGVRERRFDSGWACGLAPFNPESVAIQAGRVMISELRRHTQDRISFSFETTLSGRGYLRSIEDWQREGYVVKFLFLKLNSPEEAVARVEARVKQGGHDIPEPVIRRRYDKGLHNFHHYYSEAVDVWALYDGSGRQPKLVDWGNNA